MSLDLGKTVTQLDNLAALVREEHGHHSVRLQKAMATMKSTRPDDIQSKQSGTQTKPFLWAKARHGLAGTYWPNQIPHNFSVTSVDGSHIDVDRHLPIACTLVNIGSCVLQYGDLPEAHLFSAPKIYFGDDLYITGQAQGVIELPVEGPILGLKRTVDEVRALPTLINSIPQELPTLALLDGSLILWGLSGRGYPPLVHEEILYKGLIPAFDSLRLLSASRKLAVGAYVSFPRSTEVVNALRFHLCKTSALECRRVCSNRRSPMHPCSMTNDLMDRELFQDLLISGQRSDVFTTNSSVVREHYGEDHQIDFFYLNTGDEIARIEIPRWVSKDETLLSLTHSLILDQCHRGMGYPVAISEAHEQAVIGNPDRRRFREAIEIALTRNGLRTSTSEKSRSKRMAWL